MTLTPLEQALKCAEMGLYVVPGYPSGDYERAIIKGTQDGTTDTKLINKWWAEIPNRNVHINLKKSGLIMLDLDRHHNGQDGLKMFAALKKRYSNDQPLPPTYGESTPNDGLHYFFRVPPETFATKLVSELADGVEIKTGFTTIYPSERTVGDYRPIFGNEDGEPLTLADVADCPQWLLDLLPYKEQHKPFSERYRRNNRQPTYGGQMIMLLANGSVKGNRNSDFNKFLYHLAHRMNVPPKDCVVLLRDLNSRTSPPLSEKELTGIWKSVFK